MPRTATPTEVLGINLQAPSWPPPAEGAYLLLRETHHRLMNTLTMLAMDLRLELVGVDPSFKTALTRTEQSIVAHGELHRWLAQGALGPEVRVGEYVAELCRRMSRAVLEPLNLRCEARVEDGLLPGPCCERLGLIVCELLLNAAKHGFPARLPGRLQVELLHQVDGWSCTVTDNGQPFSPAAAAPSLGQALIDALATDLGATVITRSCPDGTAVLILLPDYGEGPLHPKPSRPEANT